MRISDWSSDVCSSDLEGERQGRALSRRRDHPAQPLHEQPAAKDGPAHYRPRYRLGEPLARAAEHHRRLRQGRRQLHQLWRLLQRSRRGQHLRTERSEEHTSELQSLMRISYAVFCLKKKNQTKNNTTKHIAKLKRKERR